MSKCFILLPHLLSRSSAGLLLLLLLINSVNLYAANEVSLSAGLSDDIQANDGSYVGVKVCKSCHEQSYQKWKNSDHDHAMKPAEDEYVLGEFKGESFEHFGLKSRFFKEDKNYFVETENSLGELETFKVLYTFGYYPLQQYLVDVGGGRLQALLTAWDSRPTSEGGQRWFHLYPEEKLGFEDPLHWTGAYFNWNSRCADCHSTNLERNYLDETKGYATTWSEINVACEACHGPGGAHAQEGNADLIKSLKSEIVWSFNDHHTAQNSVGIQKAKLSPQTSACGSCHSRRAMTGKALGKEFYDDHILSLIDSPLYYPDGQIHDEVFVLGSFMQSKMFQAGVSCTNCHDPHDLKLKAKGNNVCLQCHQTSVFDSPKHHHHKLGSKGAECVNCHMPETNYMVIDPRRDHSIRIPRPDLSLQYDVPNACADCHDDKNWLAKAFISWFDGKPLPSPPPLLVSAASELVDIVNEDEHNAIILASALSRLAQTPDQQTFNLAISRLQHTEPLVRLEAVKWMALLSADARLVYLLPLIWDKVKSVRLEVARLMVVTPYKNLSDEEVNQVESIITEYNETLLFHRDTAAGQLNIGLLALSKGDSAAAIESYRKALQIEPKHLGAHINLADVYRSIDQPKKSVDVLMSALQHFSESADLHHALGLARVREKDYENALIHLKRAFELQPDNQRYAYVYFVSLDSQGQTRKAIELMDRLDGKRGLNDQLRAYLRHLYQKAR